MKIDTKVFSEQLHLLVKWLKENEATLAIDPKAQQGYRPYCLHINRTTNYLTMELLLKEMTKLENTKIRVTACDEASTATYSKLLQFNDKEEFTVEFDKFKKEVPFKKWNTDLLDGNVRSPLMNVLAEICTESVKKVV
jgi:hypothetical protein